MHIFPIQLVGPYWSRPISPQASGRRHFWYCQALLKDKKEKAEAEMLQKNATSCKWMDESVRKWCQMRKFKRLCRDQLCIKCQQSGNHGNMADAGAQIHLCRIMQVSVVHRTVQPQACEALQYSPFTPSRASRPESRTDFLLCVCLV